MKITVISQKGGAGKTTLAINIAIALAGLPGKPDVALVDCDKQRSCLDTLAGHGRGNLTVYEGLTDPHKLIGTLKANVVICDTPGLSHELAYQCAAVSDLALVPIKASPLDVKAAAQTVKALEIIKGKYNQVLQCRFVLNQITPRTTLSSQIRHTLEKLYPAVPVMETELRNRESYKQSLLSGLSVIEYDKRSPAAQEIGQLLMEINLIINEQKGFLLFLDKNNKNAKKGKD